MALSNLFTPNNYHLYINTPSFSGNLIPDTDNIYDIGSNTLRWNEIFTYDIGIKNARIFFSAGPDIREINVTVPAPNDTMTTNNGVQILTNKTMTSPVLNTPVYNSTGGLITFPIGPAVLPELQTRTVTTTFSLGTGGPAAPSGPVDVVFVRNGNSTIGWVVTVRIPSFTCTAGNAGLSAILSANVVPTGYEPAVNNSQIGITRILNNAVYIHSVVTISSGFLRIGDLSTAPYTGSVLASLPADTILTYSTA